MSFVQSVSFISIEDEDDFILSFYVTSPDDPSGGRSLILSRDKRWEQLVDECERGVTFSDEARLGDTGSGKEYLESINLGRSIVEIESTRRTYKLDVSRVDESELRAAKKILKKMNYDDRFDLVVV